MKFWNAGIGSWRRTDVADSSPSAPRCDANSYFKPATSSQTGTVYDSTVERCVGQKHSRLSKPREMT